MIAFHGDPKIKEKYLARVRAHRAADEIVKGQYWENGKGCAVGCTIHGSNHSAYETELGIPTWLAQLEDRLFEGMPDEAAQDWPGNFLSAINPGADLSKVKAPFLIFVLESALEKFDHVKFPACKKAIDDVIALYRSGETDLDKFREACRAASASAASASASAASASAASASASAASASAAYAADAAAAAYAAYAAADAYAADAARASEYKRFADKLLLLLGAGQRMKSIAETKQHDEDF